MLSTKGEWRVFFFHKNHRNHHTSVVDLSCNAFVTLLYASGISPPTGMRSWETLTCLQPVCSDFWAFAEKRDVKRDVWVMSFLFDLSPADVKWQPILFNVSHHDLRLRQFVFLILYLVWQQLSTTPGQWIATSVVNEQSLQKVVSIWSRSIWLDVTLKHAKTIIPDLTAWNFLQMILVL